MSKKHKNLYEVIKQEKNGVKNVKNVNFNKRNLRDDFPILKKYIYLDNAATTQKPLIVIDAVKDFYLHENANSSRGIYSLSVKCSNIIDDVRKKVLEYTYLNKHEVIFTKNTTESLNMLSLSLEKYFLKKKKKNVTYKILVSSSEHHSNFITWQQVCLRNNFVFEIFNLEDENDLNKCLETKSNEEILLVAFTGMSNVSGFIPRTKELIEKIKTKSEALVVIDAAQYVAHYSFSELQNADFVVFSSHKMYGPLGVGVLLGKVDLLNALEPSFYGGNMIKHVSKDSCFWADLPNKFEPGTIDVSAIKGFGVAIDYLRNNHNFIINRELELKKYALKKLKEQDVNIIGHNSYKNYGPLISFNIDGVHPHDFASITDSFNVCIRAGHHCAQPYHKSIGLDASIRVSLSFYNDEQDIDLLIKCIVKAKELFKKNKKIHTK